MNSDSKNRIELLEEYIRNTSERKSSTSISSEALYSYRHANRLFKSIKGESIQSYSKKIRIAVGAEYLKYSSKNIFDVAIHCGYESTAAFSKAFKTMYGESPTAFRENNNFIHVLNTNLPQYSIETLNELIIQTYKIKMPSDIDFEGYFLKTKNTLNTLNFDAKEWMLLWDEDPKLTQVSESIYHLGFNIDTKGNKNINCKLTELTGRYVIFRTDSFQEYSYEIWHELACTIIETENFDIREAPYIEYFNQTSFEDSNVFFPYKIAIPIE